MVDRKQLVLDNEWFSTEMANQVFLDRFATPVEMTVAVEGPTLRLERAVTLAASKLTPEELDEVSALRDALRRINGAALVLESR